MNNKNNLIEFKLIYLIIKLKNQINNQKHLLNNYTNNKKCNKI
jgi:hypothetical protein